MVSRFLCVMPYCPPTTNTISEFKMPTFRSFSKVSGELLQVFVNSLPLREVCGLHIIYLKLGVSFPLGQSEATFITISSISDDLGNCPEFQLVACLNWSEPLLHACLSGSHIPLWKA